MKKIIRTFLLCCMAWIILPLAQQVKAAEVQPFPQNNMKVKLISTSALAATDDGYMRVFYDGTKIRVEYYDDAFEIQSKKEIDMELSLWGGFHETSDAYYLVEGENNKEEIDTAEVIRVIKYDKNWNREGAAVITSNPNIGGEVRYPFDLGCVEVTEYNGFLYVVTGHQGYVDPDYNQGHQGLLMIKVDEAAMTGEIVFSDAWHSLSQYIENVDSNLYVLEKSEGSRCTMLTKYDAETMKDDAYVSVLPYGGKRDSAWAVTCYASVDDMALSSDSILCLGTSIDQDEYQNVTADTSHNIYLTVTSMDDFTKEGTKVKWLTSYSGDGKSFMGTKLTKINDDRFMVSWEEYGESQEATSDDTLSANVLHYIFVDGHGNTISREFTVAAAISDCHPIVKGSSIVYYASNPNMVNFYSIDAMTGAFTKRSYHTVGENATWEIKDHVLTISGTGDMSMNAETKGRYPISYVSYHILDHDKDTVWNDIYDEVEKIVIGDGITCISDSAFPYFPNLTEVELGKDVTTIGEKAFYRCDKLRKINMPASVTSIGEYALASSYYRPSTGKLIVYATIYTTADTYAAKYAEENDITWVDTSKTAEEESPTKPSATGGNSTSGNYIWNINTYDEEEDEIIVPITVKKTTLSKVTSPKKKTIKVTWKKVSSVTGYQIQYAGNAKFTKGLKTITIKDNTATSKKIAKLTKGKKYYVRVRAYRKTSKSTYIGAWSKTKSVKCK